MTNSQKELAVHKESVRCMSKVFDDIAQLVGLPKEQYGDPDALMDAIQSLKDANALWERKLDEVVAAVLNELTGLRTPEYAGHPAGFMLESEVAVVVRAIKSAGYRIVRG